MSYNDTYARDAVNRLLSCMCVFSSIHSKIKECCELSTIKVYKPNEIIEENGRMKQVHIIISGNCLVMQYLKTCVTNNKIKLISPASCKTDRPATGICQAKYYFVEIGSLR